MKRIGFSTLTAATLAALTMTASIAGPRASDLEANCSPTSVQVAAAPVAHVAPEPAAVRVTAKVTVTDSRELACARAERDAAIAKAAALRQQHAAAGRRAAASRQRQAVKSAELRRLTVEQCRLYTDTAVKAAMEGVRSARSEAAAAQATANEAAAKANEADANVKALAEKVAGIETRLTAVETSQKATDIKIAKMEGQMEGNEKRLTFLEGLIRRFFPGATPASATPVIPAPTPVPVPAPPAATPTPEDAAPAAPSESPVVVPPTTPAPTAPVPPAVTPATPAEPAAPMATPPATEVPKTAATPSPVKKPARPINTNLWVLIGIGVITLVLSALASDERRVQLMILLLGALVALAWSLYSGMLPGLN